jgi:hypothetical protein
LKLFFFTLYAILIILFEIKIVLSILIRKTFNQTTFVWRASHFLDDDRWVALFVNFCLIRPGVIAFYLIFGILSGNYKRISVIVTLILLSWLSGICLFLFVIAKGFWNGDTLYLILRDLSKDEAGDNRIILDEGLLILKKITFKFNLPKLYIISKSVYNLFIITVLKT